VSVARVKNLRLDFYGLSWREIQHVFKGRTTPIKTACQIKNQDLLPEGVHKARIQVQNLRIKWKN
jgi:hypothetical protein